MTEVFLVSLAIFLRVLCNPLANVFQKQLSLKTNPLIVNFVSYFLLAILCLFAVFFIELPSLSYDFWLYSFLGGIAGALGNGFLVKALQKGDLSVLGPINSYKSVVGMIVGIFLLSEFPNFWGILGIALIIYGSYFVLDTTEEKFSWKLFKKKEIQFRIWAMILTAVEAVFIKKIIIESSTAAAFMSWCIFGALFSFIILFFYKINISTELKKTLQENNFLQFIMLIICVGTTQFATNYAFEYIPVGYALSLFQLSTIVSVFLGYRIFREKEIAKKILGSVIMIAGSVIIIFMKN